MPDDAPVTIQIAWLVNPHGGLFILGEGTIPNQTASEGRLYCFDMMFPGPNNRELTIIDDSQN